MDGFLLAAGVLAAFVALCVGCAIFEALTRPAVDRMIAEALEPDFEANINARWQG